MPRPWTETRAAAMAALTLSDFLAGDVYIRIRRQPALVNDGKAVEVHVTATRRGRSLPIDGHLIFVNPPLLVPDEERGRYRHDPEAAFRTVIAEAVMRQVG